MKTTFGMLIGLVIGAFVFHKPEDKEALDDIARVMSESADWNADTLDKIFKFVERVRKVDTTDGQA